MLELAMQSYFSWKESFAIVQTRFLYTRNQLENNMLLIKDIGFLQETDGIILANYI